MFLHAGAGLHGHEYSNTSSNRQVPAHAATVPSREDPESGMNTQRTTRPISQLLPGISYVSSLLPSAKSLWDRPSSDFFVKNYLPTRFQDVQDTSQSGPSSARTSQDSGALPLYDEPEAEPESETGPEVKCDSTCNFSQCSRAKRAKTRFHFARPAPGTHTKQKKSQPRLLLQLRREHHGRSLPSVEVVPATDIAGSKLNTGDLLIMRSDHDKSASWLGLERSASEIPGEQDVLAVVAPRGAAGDGNAEIAMEDGTVWFASRRPNGTYEFCHTTDHGNPNAVRWVKRPLSSPTATQQFNFCTMDPLVRKHPFLGSLKSSGLDIFETYTPSFSRLRDSRPASYAGDGSHPPTIAKPTATVSEEHRRLMAVTSVWVSFCEEGWPGTLPPRRGPSCRSKGAAFSRRVSQDPSKSQYEPSLPTSPTRDSFVQTSVPDRRSACGIQGQEPASTGVAYMERRRAAARAASPAASTEIAKEEPQQAETHSHRSKFRAWAHRITHPGSKASRKDTRRRSDVPRGAI